MTLFSRVRERAKSRWWATSAADLGLALALAAAGGIALANADPAPAEGRAADWLAYVLALLLTLPLAFRRRWPKFVLSICIVGILAYAARSYPSVNVDFFGPVLAFYTVAAETSRRTSITTGVVLGLIVPLASAISSVQNVDGAAHISATVVIVGVWLFGDATRQRRNANERLIAQAEELRKARLSQTAKAVTQERLRIARDLHDTVAHHMSVIVVQAAVAKARLATDPDGAARAIDEIESIGRGALREMRQVLGALRQTGDQRAELAPSPRFADIERLFSQARSGGLSVESKIEPPPKTISPAVEIASFRVIQEALTNALKHAPGAHVRVVVRQEGLAMEIEVSDDGAGSPQEVADDQGGGGLIGMRERVSILQGSFEAGHRVDKGFRVVARLPLEAAE